MKVTSTVTSDYTAANAALVIIRIFFFPKKLQILLNPSYWLLCITWGRAEKQHFSPETIKNCWENKDCQYNYYTRTSTFYLNVFCVPGQFVLQGLILFQQNTFQLNHFTGNKMRCFIYAMVFISFLFLQLLSMKNCTGGKMSLIVRLFVEVLRQERVYLRES